MEIGLRHGYKSIRFAFVLFCVAVRLVTKIIYVFTQLRIALPHLAAFYSNSHRLARPRSGSFCHALSRPLLTACSDLRLRW